MSDPKAYPSQIAPKFNVRFPDNGMRERLAEVAERNHRSMNAEILARLEESLQLNHGGVGESAGAYSIEEALLDAVRRLNREKQQALLLLITE